MKSAPIVATHTDHTMPEQPHTPAIAVPPEREAWTGKTDPAQYSRDPANIQN
jgi:hypothetical protein